MIEAALRIPFPAPVITIILFCKLKFISTKIKDQKLIIFKLITYLELAKYQEYSSAEPIATIATIINIVKIIIAILIN